MISDLPKGEATPFNYSKQGRQRVTVGILWDTPEVMPERPEAFVSELDEGTSNYDEDLDVTVGFVQETYDLDLVCLIFNEEYELVDAVSPAPAENVDLSGAIYHSGDDMKGVSAGDDEQISVELAQLPDYAHHLVFLSIIQSGHTFRQVLNAACRLADGKTNSDIWKFNLAQDNEEGGPMTACIMLSLFKNENEGWMVRNISEYRLDKKVEDWALEIQKAVFQKIE